jgi:hypothetical protein
LGDAVAMSTLGILYAYGRGVARDYAEARRWFEKAANLGDAGAMNELGLLYYHGRGVSRSYREARSWFEKSAAAGFAVAMTNVGIFYHKGEGVPRDLNVARQRERPCCRRYVRSGTLGYFAPPLHGQPTRGRAFRRRGL